MKSFTKDGTAVAMTYDADGLRSSKTVAGVKTEYQYVGDKLFYENRGNGDSFYYFYDSYGKLAALYHNRNGTKTAYHVVTNAQGDVVALYSWAGALVATYEYDAWGNCTIVSDTSSTGIATLNPMRYRGYYYDKDLGLYYLQSRYYDAEIGRFLNSDNVTDSGAGIIGFNTYVYCGNSPVNATDPTGHGMIKDALKWAAKKVLNTITSFKKQTSDINATYQTGITASASVFVEGSVSVSVACDLKGNLGIAYSYSYGLGLPNASLSKFKTVTNAPSIDRLKGTSYQLGGSVDVSGVSVGAEYTTFADPVTDEQYSGISVSAGVGVPGPVEAHVDIAETEVIYFNVYEKVEMVCVEILDW